MIKIGVIMEYEILFFLLCKIVDGDKKVFVEFYKIISL